MNSRAFACPLALLALLAILFHGVECDSHDVLLRDYPSSDVIDEGAHAEVDGYLQAFKAGTRPSWELLDSYSQSTGRRRSWLRKFPPSLLLVVAGAEFNETKWQQDASGGAWDLAVISYAEPGSVNCPACVHVFYGKGAKWRLIYLFTKSEEYEQIREHYGALGFADEDLELHDRPVYNTVFEAIYEYRLLMAQPSLCREPNCFTPYGALYQDRDLTLLYTNFIEVMTPVFEMEFFDELVRHTLYRAHFGWLLDFLWPWLLGYPIDKIAVIERVCVFHPRADRDRDESLYKKAVAPRGPTEERDMQAAEWKYSERLRKQRRFSVWRADVVGIVYLNDSRLSDPNVKTSLCGDADSLCGDFTAAYNAALPHLLLPIRIISGILVVGLVLVLARRTWKSFQTQRTKTGHSPEHGRPRTPTPAEERAV